MNDFERRAQQAARAVHEQAATLSNIGAPVRTRSTQLALAAVLVVLAVAGVALVMQSGDGDDPALATSRSARAERTVEILEQFVDGRYEHITRDFAPDMAAEFSAAALATEWAKYESAFGGYDSHDQPSETTVDGNHVVTLPLTMGRQPGALRVTFTSDGQIAGLLLHAFDPAQAAKAEAVTRLITQERWGEVRMEFNEQMLEAVSEAELAAVWAEAKRQGGDLLGIGTPTVAVQDEPNTAYDTILDFQGRDATIRIAFDPSNKVSGLFILPR